MRGKNLIFDFESLGTNIIKGFPLLDVAYYVFDTDRFMTNPYTFDELINKVQYAKFDVAHYYKTYGYKPELSTIEWWNNQDPSVKNKIKPSKADITIEEFADKFLAYLRDNLPTFWWSRGNTFDPIIMYRIFDDLKRSSDFNNLCPHWAVRDVRTYIDAQFDFDPKIENGFILPEWKEKFNKHDSVHDISVDILRLQMIVREKNG